jgi:hypothetical protein
MVNDFINLGSRNWIGLCKQSTKNSEEKHFKVDEGKKQKLKS